MGADNVALGYRYGAEVVTISEEDESAAKFDGGPKSLALFGFLAASQVKHHQLVGDGCMIFLPSEGDANSDRAWSALLQAMLELKVSPQSSVEIPLMYNLNLPPSKNNL